MKINLRDIKEETGHYNSVYKKPLLKASDRNGKVATFNYAWLTQGMMLAPHSHPDGEEYYLFLEGAGEMMIDDDWFQVVKGDFVTVPINSMHSLKNTNRKNLVFITLRTKI